MSQEAQMSVTPFDSPMMRDLLSDKELAGLFTDQAEVRAILLFEGALARAQGKLGLIPELSGEAIHRAARETAIDPSGLAAGTASAGVSIPALVAQFREEMNAPEHAAFAHWGATSQDAADTGQALRLKRLAAVLDARLAEIIAALGDAAEEHAELPMAARTRAQIATPTTFGARVAAWGAPLIRARARLARAAEGVALVSLAGASGNMAAMGAQAEEVARLVGEELGLSVPALPWHAGRDGLAEFGAALAILCGSLGKMGQDLVLLGQSEIGEVRAGEGGGSSTMPHKSNPVGAEALVALARHASRLSGGLQEALIFAGERDGAAWQLEWMSLGQLCVAAGAATRHAQGLARSLRPDGARMLANMDATGGLMMAEAAMFALAQAMPRPEAQALVKAACATAVEQGAHLRAVLEERKEARGADLGAAFDYSRHVGLAPVLAMRFAQMAREG
ncbi:lyase family protein [Rhodovulum sp. DZ06]|uniref:lyase family protein n=1 Tax=Rhodovulum sp. DZ06 TaxID=3425126 RepID=UPI003D33C30B